MSRNTYADERAMYASGKSMASTSPDDAALVKTATNHTAMATSSAHRTKTYWMMKTGMTRRNRKTWSSG